VDAGELGLMLEGLDLRGAHRRPRWYRVPSGNGPAVPDQDRERGGRPRARCLGAAG